MNEQFTKKMYWLHCLSPLHLGSGEGAGYIDNPLMREKVTGFPFVPGSSIKGVIKAQYSGSENGNTAFGTGGDNQDKAGALIFTDAYLICLPVRSLYGTFAWVSAPLVLNRLQRDWAELPAIPEVSAVQISLTENSVLTKDGKVFLEDLDLTVQKSEESAKIADKIAKNLWQDNQNKWQEIFKQRFAIVSDVVFSFLSETATQVDTRIRINPDSDVVDKGALWTEESLPAESILAGMVYCDNQLKSDKDLLKDYCTEEIALQLGGNITVGRGQTRCVFSNAEESS
ncbi:type III-B CRISPR module RAMP protein Cmr4 [Stenoxybacter acetivorans]|uniref:type III-B CRISPR module RAMP protein Cmr4 n=1 Tax=Stenoxybacter acetivorans TaxID=422441 RepID=UPI000560E043|nr:type III-B CRISPR module RAMP protein Cmr4 [Stenoxybacter acetivorans]